MGGPSPGLRTGGYSSRCCVQQALHPSGSFPEPAVESGHGGNGSWTRRILTHVPLQSRAIFGPPGGRQALINSPPELRRECQPAWATAVCLPFGGSFSRCRRRRGGRRYDILQRFYQQTHAHPRRAFGHVRFGFTRPGGAGNIEMHPRRIPDKFL